MHVPTRNLESAVYIAQNRRADREFEHSFSPRPPFSLSLYVYFFRLSYTKLGLNKSFAKATDQADDDFQREFPRISDGKFPLGHKFASEMLDDNFDGWLNMQELEKRNVESLAQCFLGNIKAANYEQAIDDFRSYQQLGVTSLLKCIFITSISAFFC